VRQERDTALAASQARASFLAQMSHEIREPMNNVLGMARLLRDTPLDPEQRGYVDAVVDAAEALLTLINDILDLTRIDTGRLELDETDVALRPFLDRLRALLEPQARRKGLAFTVEADASVPPLLHTDPSRLRQVLINLAANALKFTEQGRVAIRFSLCPAPTGKVGVRVEVEDTGPGIPRPALDRLFEAYGQADQVARLFGGSGLGLMIAHRLSRALGGEIAVRSDTLAGTTFMVDLALSPPAGEAAGTGVAAVPPSLAGCSLLVVDPQERTRSAIVELASGWGIAARGARSATQGLALLDEAADRGAPYHAVLIDRVLPDLPGNQLGQRILAEARYGRPHLVLLVASGIRGDAARARADGFSAYLPKPVTAQMLLECLTVLRAGAAGAEHAGEGGGAAAAGPLITVHTMADRRPHLDVLVADDNAVNCRLLQIVLERAGHRVTVVRNGLEAVRALEGSPFDLVLMDIQMPTMDGLEATRRIRQLPDPVRATTPVVAVTANAMRGDVTACYAAGMDGYVTKPVTMASLNDAIGRSLSPRRPPPAPAKADRPLAPDAALPPAPMST
jgi:two-component system sensor histidine kinase/response regulator